MTTPTPDPEVRAPALATARLRELSVLRPWVSLASEIRSIAEHFAIPARPGLYGDTRTTLPTIFDRLLVASYGIHYHTEHHLYPSVPTYNLAKLHAALCEDPGYAANLYVSRGYHRVLFGDCVGHQGLFTTLK